MCCIFKIQNEDTVNTWKKITRLDSEGSRPLEGHFPMHLYHSKSKHIPGCNSFLWDKCWCWMTRMTWMTFTTAVLCWRKFQMLDALSVPYVQMFDNTSSQKRLHHVTQLGFQHRGRSGSVPTTHPFGHNNQQKERFWRKLWNHENIGHFFQVHFQVFGLLSEFWASPKSNSLLVEGG